MKQNSDLPKDINVNIVHDIILFANLKLLPD